MRTPMWRQAIAASGPTLESPGPTSISTSPPSLRPASYAGSPRLGAATTRALRAASGAGNLSWGLRTAFVPWVIARVVVAGALVAAHELVNQAKPSAAVAARV